MKIFENGDTEALIIVDASNAFNWLNRHTTLANVNTCTTCPALAPTLINAYRSPFSLRVNGQTLISQEGTTQGDPLGMAMYTIGTQPCLNGELSLAVRDVNTWVVP